MRQPATPSQMKLDLGVEVESDIEGVEMGVLENGMAYLTQRGLAAMSGAARSTIQEISKEWEDNYGTGMEPPGRVRWFSDYLRDAGYDVPTLYTKSNPQQAWAYPEDALPEFRRWFRNIYLPTKYPSYILRKASVLSGGKDQAEQIANLYQPKQLR